MIKLARHLSKKPGAVQGEQRPATRQGAQHALTDGCKATTRLPHPSVRRTRASAARAVDLAVPVGMSSPSGLGRPNQETLAACRGGLPGGPLLVVETSNHHMPTTNAELY